MNKITYTNTLGEQIVISDKPPFVLSEKSGFDGLSNTISDTLIYGMDGSQLINTRLDTRNITLGGLVIGKTNINYLDYRRELIRIFNPTLSGRIRYETKKGIYEIDVIPEFLPQFNDGQTGGIKTGSSFRVILKALDPYLIDKSEIDAEIPMTIEEKLLTFPFEITENFVFSQLIAGDVIEIRNNGDVSVGAVFTINVNAPLVNPQIFNVITREYFKIRGSFITGTKIRVSTLRGDKRVEQNDGDGWYNIMTKREVSSTFLQIARGINYLQLQADSGVKNTTSFIKFEPKILGV